MRNTLPLSFRTPVSLSRARSPTPVATPPPVIPTIKLTAATPSVAGTPSANTSLVSTILAPKPPGEARKKVVPKKSKMSILSVGSKRQEKGKDLSDVKRRVGVSPSSTSRSFDIYVDPTDDPDIGEVVFVQKKKSRAGLNGVFTNALGDVTNTVEEKEKPEPKVEKKVDKSEKASKLTLGTLKVKEKREEKEKWWTLGRSRRDSKEKTKDKLTDEKVKTIEEPQKVKSDLPEPIVITDSRQRAHSFDSGILLNTPTTALSKPTDKPLPDIKDDTRPPTVRINTSPTLLGSRPGTPASTALLSPPSTDKPQSGSIALRAMRSIARIGSWAQLRNTPSPDGSDSSPDEVKKEKRIFGKTKRTKSVRSAASSFEAGGLTPVSGIFNNGTVRTNKSSTGTIMTVSSLNSYASGGSSAPSVHSGGNRLSVASSVGTVSSGSCKSVVEPILANGRQSKRNSGSSVRWDDQVDTVKDKKVDAKSGRESRGKIEGRRRPAISALFPDAMASKSGSEERIRSVNPNRPLLTLSAASPDRNYENEIEVLSMTSMSSTETPVKKPRPRPMSENMLGRVRPRAITGDDIEGGFMDAATATNDLASLINRLDLQATPDASPMGTSPGTLRSVLSDSTRNDDTGKFSLPESPSKRAFKTLSKESSVSSLRPYASPKSKSSVPQQPSKLQIGEQIAPWPAFSSHLETLHETSPITATQPKSAPTFRLSHKRTLSPPAPAMDPLPVFHPLPAAKAKNTLPVKSASPTSSMSNDSTPRLAAGSGSFVDASSQTFGVRPSRVSNGVREGQDSPTAVGKFRIHERKRSSLVPFDVDSDSGGVLMDSTARRALGMRGTMGSVGSISGFDPDEQDSDIPDELHVILCASRRNSACSTLDVRGENSTAESLPPSPGVPPSLPLPSVAPVSHERVEAPVFRALLIDDEQHEADLDETSDSSDDDGKSFDFTGEIKQLNESGAADRRSFVMQLEDAFKTQAQIDIDGLGAHLGLQEAIPPMPPLPLPPRLEEVDDDSALPALSADTRLDDLPLKSHSSRDHLRGIPSKASDGQLNRDFKFGGRPTSPATSSEVYVMEKPITLSDIIPPLSHIEHVHRQSMSSVLDEDNSVLKSIYAQAVDLPERNVPEVPQIPVDSRPRLESDSSDKQRARQEALSQLTAHSRQDSDVSFSGMSSFDEVRRGFEFNDSRPVFYPPANISQASSQSHRGHGQQESVFSIASVSSYGAVVKSGSFDPFGYGYALSTRPLSEEMSMSMNVDDTFSFLRRDPARQRVDSDASSFYFNSSRDVSKRHRRQNDSMASAFSGPPISLYNRSYGAHRKSDSSTSASSIAHAYGAFGANGGRAAWARHNRDFSVDSVASGYSARLGRPGVGDKMFESAREHGVPLTSISASPSQSVDTKDIRNRTSFDSILDADRRSSMDDSLFDETGRRSSISSASVFGYESHHPLPVAPGLLPPHQFRPVSVISVNSSHGTKAEDDTMITMLGGGHVRRRSIGSTFDNSPSNRMRHHRYAKVNFKKGDITSDDDMEYPSALDKAQIVEKPSVASSMSHQFGVERMSLAQKGLLQRQSLEDSCLSGEGEDMSFSAPLVFRKPSPTSHPRDSQSSLSSGADTPPLSISDTSSQSSGSQSSIDISRLSALLANSTVPAPTTAQARARARARGQGHRRRISQAQASRSRNSVYETIEEECSGASNASSPIKMLSEDACSPISRASQYEPDVHIVEWDQDDVGPALRRYFALKNEAHETVFASQQLWADTPFSLYALQSFEPPEYPHGMQAVLEHSQKTYRPLPAELRALRRRSRTLSRPSPYPRSRKTSESSLHSRKSSDCGHLEPSLMQQLAAPLQEVRINHNVPAVPQTPAPALNPLNPFTPFAVKFNGDKSLAISEKDLPVRAARPRVPSNARRTALGWSKRSTGKTANENKENASFSAMMSPNESLRIVRPRPRGRATPSSRAIRV